LKEKKKRFEREEYSKIKIPEPACHVNIKLTSTGSSLRFSIYQRKEATGRDESLIRKN
jgi:hypothetical protein